MSFLALLSVLSYPIQTPILDSCVRGRASLTARGRTGLGHDFCGCSCTATIDARDVCRPEYDTFGDWTSRRIELSARGCGCASEGVTRMGNASCLCLRNCLEVG